MYPIISFIFQENKRYNSEGEKFLEVLENIVYLRHKPVESKIYHHDSFKIFSTLNHVFICFIVYMDSIKDSYDRSTFGTICCGIPKEKTKIGIPFYKIYQTVRQAIKSENFNNLDLELLNMNIDKLFSDRITKKEIIDRIDIITNDLQKYGLFETALFGESNILIVSDLNTAEDLKLIENIMMFLPQFEILENKTVVGVSNKVKEEKASIVFSNEEILSKYDISSMDLVYYSISGKFRFNSKQYRDIYLPQLINWLKSSEEDSIISIFEKYKLLKANLIEIDEFSRNYLADINSEIRSFESNKLAYTERIKNFKNNIIQYNKVCEENQSLMHQKNIKLKGEILKKDEIVTKLLLLEDRIRDNTMKNDTFSKITSTLSIVVDEKEEYIKRVDRDLQKISADIVIINGQVEQIVKKVKVIKKDLKVKNKLLKSMMKKTGPLKKIDEPNAKIGSFEYVESLKKKISLIPIEMRGLEKNKESLSGKIKMAKKAKKDMERELKNEKKLLKHKRKDVSLTQNEFKILQGQVEKITIEKNELIEEEEHAKLYIKQIYTEKTDLSHEIEKNEDHINYLKDVISSLNDDSLKHQRAHEKNFVMKKNLVENVSVLKSRFQK